MSCVESILIFVNISLIIKQSKVPVIVDAAAEIPPSGNLRKFISDGCKLKVTLMYRGRELSRTDLGLAVLERVIEMLSDIAEVEKEGDLEGRRQTIVLTGK